MTTKALDLIADNAEISYCGTTVYFGGQEVRAEDFGVTEAEYREWARCTRLPRCCAKKKSGEFCDNVLAGPIGNSFEDPREFLRRHRSRPCHLHQKTNVLYLDFTRGRKRFSNGNLTVGDRSPN
jgi:hypothetical protein